jgi:hypothetical protein
VLERLGLKQSPAQMDGRAAPSPTFALSHGRVGIAGEHRPHLRSRTSVNARELTMVPKCWCRYSQPSFNAGSSVVLSLLHADTEFLLKSARIPVKQARDLLALEILDGYADL